MNKLFLLFFKSELEGSRTKEFEELEAIQFEAWSPEIRDLFWGIFGEKDTLAHFEPLFLNLFSAA